jgi:peptide/nickel transport system substrate-binding protein
MKALRSFVPIAMVLCLILTPLLAACGSTPAPTAAPTAAPTVAATSAATQPQAPTATKTPPTSTAVPATPTKAAPKVGGTLVKADSIEPDTLDPHRTNMDQAKSVIALIGGALITKDPATGKYIPYLAEKFEGSTDGLSWTFTLKKGIKFHDGSPCTAKEYAWSINRGMSPEVKSPTMPILLKNVKSVEAIDDLTLVFKLAAPNYPLLESLTQAGNFSPIPQGAVETLGADFGRHPVSVGPFKFKEWITGERIVLERNPDYTWGPSYTRGGPPFIEAIKILYIGEYATIVAGLEAGEIDLAFVQPADLDRISGTGKFDLLGRLAASTSPMVHMNTSRPPFDDVRVRQALNYASDREALIKVVVRGYGQPQYGPISPSVTGYWPGVEQIGYKYDLDKAKALMKEAGYTPGASGFLEKDGKPAKFGMMAISTDAPHTMVASVLKEQYKALGLDIDVKLQETGLMFAAFAKGDYDLAVWGWPYPDCSVMYAMFHSSMIGALNHGRVKDPELDKLLDQMAGATSTKANEDAAAAVQKRVVEQAYIVVLYTSKFHTALAKRVKGVLFSPITGSAYLEDAYIQTN